MIQALSPVKFGDLGDRLLMLVALILRLPYLTRNIPSRFHFFTVICGKMVVRLFSQVVRESAGIIRLGIGNERVLQGKLSQLLWPRTVRWLW